MLRTRTSRPQLQLLETRAVPATFTVLNTANSGTGSLRQAILDANAAGGADTIVFDAAAFATAQTITLTSGQLSITDAVAVNGPAVGVTITTNGTGRVLNIDVAGSSANPVSLSDLTLTKGAVAGRGAGIQNQDEALTLTRVTVSNCTASGDGGGIAIIASPGTLTLVNSSVSGNTASQIGSSGGGIACEEDSTVSLVNSTVENNSAGTNGGGIYFYYGGSLSVTNSTISGNKALTASSSGIGGGGIYFYGATTGILIQNSTISGNTANRAGAGYGGGIMLQYFYGGTVIQNSTITGNDAGKGGGGIAQTDNLATWDSTIIAGNTVNGAVAPTSDVLFVAATTVGGDNNLIGVQDAATNATFGAATQTGSFATPLDAKLGPLQNNGGPTKTHALLPGSPALDTGNNTAGLTTDQRGGAFARTSGTGTDVGAFEVQATAAPPPTATIKIDDGTAQRSMIQSFTVTFSEPVNLGANPFTLTRLGTSTNPSPTGNVTVSVAGSGSSYTITFNDPTFAPTVGSAKSLIDGKYTLTLNASQITSVATGQQLDGDGNGTAGDNQAQNFGRIFGDVNGDGFTDLQDFLVFRQANGSQGPNPPYTQALDVNGDGFVDLQDFLAFRQRLGQSP